MSDKRPIIIIKRKKSHGGHHGGAWKVAYADFVTALMALFIVLWIVNTNQAVRHAVSGYFKDQVEMTITNEGLRIELLETDKGVFFESGSPHPTRFGQELMELLAVELGKLENYVMIEGHTDSKPFVSQNGYS